RSAESASIRNHAASSAQASVGLPLKTKSSFSPEYAKGRLVFLRHGKLLRIRRGLGEPCSGSNQRPEQPLVESADGRLSSAGRASRTGSLAAICLPGSTSVRRRDNSRAATCSCRRERSSSSLASLFRIDS